MTTLQNTTLTTISVLILTLFSGCIFDTVENEQILGPYLIIGVDIPENMCIVYNEKEDYSGGGTVVSATVFEVAWNNNFIIAKQHPKDIERIILNNYSEHAFDSLKKSGHVDKIHLLSDSLAKSKFQANKIAGLFDNFKGKTKNEVTFYYVIDTREKSPYSTLYFNKQQLDSALMKLNAGRLDKRKYYDYLDKR